jgi:DNA-binding CsgD family transcriptional regulator
MSLMTLGHHALTEKEKQTLRLLLAGHDAKSMARHLGLSVHTVNERLRDSRRKLSASSSREAARLLRDAEAVSPQSLVDNQLGAAAISLAAENPGPSTASAPTRRQTVWIAGVIVMMSLALALFALSSAAPQAEAPIALSAQAEIPAVLSARQWLEMGDASDWKGSWAATGASFRKLNTLAVWTSVSAKVRVPLGTVFSRTLIGADEVPTPPSGNTVVKFRTRFANKADAVETIALTREGGTWKVVGCYIE